MREVGDDSGTTIYCKEVQDYLKGRIEELSNKEPIE